jgi:hypothetical protein
MDLHRCEQLGSDGACTHRITETIGGHHPIELTISTRPASNTKVADRPNASNRRLWRLRNLMELKFRRRPASPKHGFAILAGGAPPSRPCQIGSPPRRGSASTRDLRHQRGIRGTHHGEDVRQRAFGDLARRLDQAACAGGSDRRKATVKETVAFSRFPSLFQNAERKSRRLCPGLCP